MEEVCEKGMRDHPAKDFWCLSHQKALSLLSFVSFPWVHVEGTLSVGVREVLETPPWQMLWAFGTAQVPC